MSSKFKWMIYLLLPFLLLLVLYFIGRKSVHTELVIPASPEEVWLVLKDAPAYKEWNPVLIPVEGELKEGAKVRYEFRQYESNTSEIPSTVKKMIPGKLLNRKTTFRGDPHREILRRRT